MPSITKFKGGFFDRPAVIKQMDAHARKALSKGGAFVRRTARQSLKYRNKAAPVGQPPSVHRQSKGGGSPLKDLLFFAWDARRRSVVVGPAAFRGSAIVPGVLEKGGAVRIHEVKKRVSVKSSLGRGAGGRFVSVKRMEEQWVLAKPQDRRRNLPQRVRSARVGPYPYMHPALEKNRGAIVGAFRK